MAQYQGYDIFNDENEGRSRSPLREDNESETCDIGDSREILTTESEMGDIGEKEKESEKVTVEEDESEEGMLGLSPEAYYTSIDDLFPTREDKGTQCNLMHAAIRPRRPGRDHTEKATQCELDEELRWDSLKVGHFINGGRASMQRT